MTQRQKDAVARAMKGLRFSVKSADEGTLTAVFATFGVKDLDGDVTLPGAFEDGAEVLISWYNHGTWGDNIPVGKGVIHQDDTKAWVEAQLWLDIEEGAKLFKVIKNAGDLQEYSYGYRVLKTGEITEEMRQAGVYRVLEKLKVFEVSPVMVGAGIDTGTVSIKSAKEEETPPAPPVPTAEELAAKAAVRTDAMREFARFQKTAARLIVGVADTRGLVGGQHTEPRTGSNAA